MPPWARRIGRADSSPHSHTAMATPWLSTVRCRSGRRAPGKVIASLIGLHPDRLRLVVASPETDVLLGRAPAPVDSAAMLHGLRRRASGHRHLLTGSAALVLTAGVQAISGALFWLIAARVDEQTDVGHATALSLLLDVRLMTQRRWGLVLARASIVGFARFPLLLIPVDQNRAVWLLVVAALPTAVSGFLGTAWLPKVTGHRHVFGPKPATARAWARYSLV